MVVAVSIPPAAAAASMLLREIACSLFRMTHSFFGSFLRSFASIMPSLKLRAKQQDRSAAHHSISR
jgi:hypothetical protein